jgi:hypothetical protein
MMKYELKDFLQVPHFNFIVSLILILASDS